MLVCSENSCSLSVTLIESEQPPLLRARSSLPDTVQILLGANKDLPVSDGGR
jgi:hypothetical protein